MPVAALLALAGAWVGSTLAVFHGYAVWLVLLLVPVAFFLLPLLWELLADRDQVGGRFRDAVLRSSFFGLVLISVLVATHAETTYKALATRGDWFLAGSRTPAAESIRRFMLRAADGFHWVHELSKDTFLRTEKTVTDAIKGRPPGYADPQAALDGKGPPGFPIPGSNLRWPLDPTPHPAALQVPEAAQATPKALGAWFRAQVADEFMRAKAIHDFIALNIKYDHEGLLQKVAHTRGRQEAPTVLSSRRAVCAGFARLFKAVAIAAGFEAEYVNGPIRWSSDYAAMGLEALEASTPGADRGHAWNAIKIGQHWHLVDTTWDKANTEGEIESTYLFTPPEAMLTDHFPEDSDWQLLEPKVSLADWWRSPTLSPIAVFHGLRLRNIDRPFVARAPTIRVEIANPYGNHISVHLKEDRHETSKTLAAAALSGTSNEPRRFGRCGEGTNANPAIFECAVPAGRIAATIFSGMSRKNMLYVGQVGMEE